MIACFYVMRQPIRQTYLKIPAGIRKSNHDPLFTRSVVANSTAKGPIFCHAALPRTMLRAGTSSQHTSGFCPEVVDFLHILIDALGLRLMYGRPRTAVMQSPDNARINKKTTDVGGFFVVLL